MISFGVAAAFGMIGWDGTLTDYLPQVLIFHDILDITV
jgi:hypothetical protein